MLVVDDHTLFRKGVMRIIENDPKIEIVDEAVSGKEAVNKINSNPFDCILLDIWLPGENGLQVLKQIKCIDPDIPVIMLSMYPEGQYGIRALRAGASGYVTKTIPPRELINSIHTVCNGGKYISTNLALELATMIDKRIKGPLHESLTDREMQILTLMATGKSVSKIAREFNLSVKTVSTHRANILKKMGFDNNAELIRYAINNRLVF